MERTFFSLLYNMVIALVRKYRGETTSSNKQLLVLSWLKYPCVETSLSHEESQCFSSWTVDTWAKMSRFFASTKRLQKTLGFSLHSKCKLHLHCICFGPCRNAALFSRAGMGSWLQWPSCPAVLHFRSRPLMPNYESVRISNINKPKITWNFIAQKHQHLKNMIFLYYWTCFFSNKPAIFTNHHFFPETQDIEALARATDDALALIPSGKRRPVDLRRLETLQRKLDDAIDDVGVSAFVRLNYLSPKDLTKNKKDVQKEVGLMNFLSFKDLDPVGFVFEGRLCFLLIWKRTQSWTIWRS